MSALVLAAALILQGDPAADPKASPADAFQADPAWKPIGKGVWFDPKGKRLVLRARVALRDGALEHLLCAENTKEHESVLATDAPPRAIHAGLLLTGAEPGHPVRFRPTFQPPAGTPIAIDLEWSEGGKIHRANARDWIKDAKDDALLKRDWVFAGSQLYTDPETKETHYAADDGDLITVANFPGAICDLPFASTADDAGRSFVGNTPAIPPRGTPVTMFLRPAKPTTP